MSLKNVSIDEFRQYCRHKGLNCIGIKGGHEKWSKKSMLRPVIFQTHIDPLPEFIVRSNLKSMGSDRREFEEWQSNR